MFPCIDLSSMDLRGHTVAHGLHGISSEQKNTGRHSLPGTIGERS